MQWYQVAIANSECYIYYWLNFVMNFIVNFESKQVASAISAYKCDFKRKSYRRAEVAETVRFQKS